MRQKIKSKKPIDRVAVSLVLCFSVVAMASVFTVKSSLDKIGMQNPDSNTNHGTYQEQLVTKRVPVVDSKDTNKQNPKDTAPKTSAWLTPVSGSLGLPYSADVPVYSKTLNQYMVHTGVDILAPLESRVQATASGTIIEATMDDYFGYTVKISHDNGFISTYSNLSDEGLPEIGDVVNQGDIIGSVGNTSLFESSEDPHIHFELAKDGKTVNPMDYFSL